MSSCELICSVLDVVRGDLMILILMREELSGQRGRPMQDPVASSLVIL